MGSEDLAEASVPSLYVKQLPVRPGHMIRFPTQESSQNIVTSSNILSNKYIRLRHETLATSAWPNRILNGRYTGRMDILQSVY